jgi:MSHA biogenesis protein MshQ
MPAPAMQHPNAPPRARPLALAWLFAWLVLAVLLAPSRATAATYTFRSDTFQWETASTAVVWDRLCTGFPGDDDQATITFSGGFRFTFAGVPYSSVRVLSNGALQFGAETGFHRTYTNTTLPAATPAAQSGCAQAAVARTIMAYWTDLNPAQAGSGGVTWQQKGTAPNRYVVVSWNSVFQYNTSTPYTFQIILFENGEFKFQYGNDNASGARATIGVQVSTSDYSLYSFNSGYAANGSAIRWSLDSGVATRLADYRFDEFGYTGSVGEVRDSSGNSRHGLRVGAATSSATGYICRALSVPANTSSSSAAVDTLVNPASGVGNAGSLSFWFNSNVPWSSTGAATLMDATLATSRAFHLQRSSGGALRFTLADSAGTSLTATSAAQGLAAGTWVHVVASWRLAPGNNQSALRLWVNGVQVASTLGTTNGTIDPTLGSLYVGDNRSASTAGGGSPNSANGLLDELRIYNYEIGLAEIAIDRANAHDCLPPVDHYELSMPSQAVSCAATTVTVTACADSSRPCSNRATSVAGQTASLSTNPGASVTPLPTFNASGVATATLSHPAAADGEVVTVTLSGETTVAVNGRQCCPDGVACASGNSCSVTLRTAGFVFAASAGGAATTLPHQTAGQSSGTWFLRAVRSNSNTQACEGALAGSTSVEWAQVCRNPATCVGGDRMVVSAASSATVAGNPASGITRTTAVTMNFDSAGNAPFSFTHGDAGQVALFARKQPGGTLLARLEGSSNAFVVRPAGFTLSGIGCASYAAGRCAVATLAAPGNNPAAADASGPAFLPAGESFTATVTAVGATGAALPSFGRESPAEGVRLSASLVAPAGGVDGTLANASAFGSFSAGAASGSTFQYSEVGVIRLTPSVADGDYLGSGDVTGAASGLVGRFVPARFTLDASSLGNRAGASCSPASSFTYLGENFTLDVTLSARNAAGGVTRNYGGSFARFNPAAAAAWNLAGLSGSTAFNTGNGRLALGSVSGSWSSGTLAARLSAAAVRQTGPEGPFAAAFGIAPVDGDGTSLTAHDMSASAGGPNDRTRVGGTTLLHGRLRLANASGSADRELALPVQALSWNGSLLEVNSADSCTRVPAAAVSLGQLRGSLVAADARVASGASLVAGRGSLRLAAPGGGRRGTLDVALSLGTAAADTSCLQTWSPVAAATTGAALEHLRAPWCGASAQDPSARATFGRQPGEQPMLYRRENF